MNLSSNGNSRAYTYLVQFIFDQEFILVSNNFFQDDFLCNIENEKVHDIIKKLRGIINKIKVYIN